MFNCLKPYGRKYFDEIFTLAPDYIKEDFTGENS